MTKKSKWVLKQPNPETAKKIEEALKLHPLCANVLCNRGIETPEQASAFLNPSVSALLDPFLLQDMEKGVTKIKETIAQNQKI
ncbi:MAG: single-stranded-DNA-specific exonuclease RecJ, partial [Clostridia bacterium]|nr:single-stranded-DNA-specific exonuclease RecJ [Clostridia bacterium]